MTFNIPIICYLFSSSYAKLTNIYICDVLDIYASQRVCVVHTPETAAPIKRAGTSFIEMGSSETVLRASVVISPHRRRSQRRYSKCVSAKQSARNFFTILVYSNEYLGNV